jgi:hypothetical protein
MIRAAPVLLLLACAVAHAGSRLDAVLDCGADPAGVRDSSPGLNACIAGRSQAALYFPPGDYRLNSTVAISGHNVTLYSDARATATLRAYGCGDAFRFSSGTQEIFNDSIRNLQIYGTGSCPQTAVHVVDGSWFEIDNAQILGFDDARELSVGVRTEGREGFHLTNSNIQANLPVSMGANPNHPYIAADHVHIADLYSIVTGAKAQNYHISLDSGVVITNMTIDGQNPFARGCGILKWIKKAAPVSVSYMLKISNLRFEQQSAGCGAQVDIEQPLDWPLQELLIDNVAFNPSPNAVRLVNVDSVTIAHSRNPSPVAGHLLDATNLLFLELRNNTVTPLSDKIFVDGRDLEGGYGHWVLGPARGKHCCEPDGVRSMDSGTWSRN